MPIQIKCQCGKTLNVKDEFAGKAVKCPGCGSPIRVPAAGQRPASPRPAAARSAPQSAPQSDDLPGLAPATERPNRMDDLFDEEGFSAQVAAICPSCAAEMSAEAVLCTKCGYNKQTGEFLDGHKTAGVDIDHGTMALMKAEDDMKRSAQLQKDMLNNAGMPWWALALVLFCMGTFTSIAVLAVNASRRVDENLSFNPKYTAFVLAGSRVCGCRRRCFVGDRGQSVPRGAQKGLYVFADRATVYLHLPESENDVADAGDRGRDWRYRRWTIFDGSASVVAKLKTSRESTLRSEHCHYERSFGKTLRTNEPSRPNFRPAFFISCRMDSDRVIETSTAKSRQRKSTAKVNIAWQPAFAATLAGAAIKIATESPTTLTDTMLLDLLAAPAVYPQIARGAGQRGQKKV